MRQSVLFTKPRKENPADETARSAQLLMRAGYIAKEMAGVYDLLPLGLRVMNKIAAIIRRELNAIGSQEVFLTTLQDPAIWQASGRWSDQAVDNWFKTKLKNGNELGLALTHEEALARIMRDHVKSYRDLPKLVYQIQTKFRNELRAKSGMLRGREFLMKDLYSFTTNTAQLDTLYDQVAEAYQKIFASVGLGDRTLMTFASGGVFSKYSHEFQTICPTGEDTIYVVEGRDLAINQEVFTDEVLSELKVKKSDVTAQSAIEVGNIFKLGTKYAEAVGLMYTDEQGHTQPVVMGSYGIGVGRLMATIAEVLSDDHGLVWPKEVAPFDVHVIEINPKGDADISAAAKKLTHDLEAKGREVLCDERDVSAGAKLSESDLLGLPTRVVISAKTVAAKKLEVRDRRSGEVRHLTAAALLKELSATE